MYHVIASLMYQVERSIWDVRRVSDGAGSTGASAFYVEVRADDDLGVIGMQHDAADVMSALPQSASNSCATWVPCGFDRS
jgi:hypothetical protein